jgi:hypothetical protein
MLAKKINRKQPRERWTNIKKDVVDKEKGKVRRTIRREKDEVTRRSLGDREKNEAK